MLLRTTTNSGAELRLELFEPAITREDVEVTITNINEIGNEDQIFERDKKKYFPHIYLPDWEEMLLVFKGQNPSVNPRNLEVLATTSYHVQAVRKGGRYDITPIAVAGLILTKDNKFVCGVRGGNHESGKVCISPAGSLSLLNLHNRGNPLFATFHKELEEELGIKKDDSDNPQLIGVEYQTEQDETKGVKFVFYMPTKESSREIDEKHKEAFNVYQKAISNGVPEVEARREIQYAGIPNSDAWEHTKLLFIDNNPKLIGEIIQSRGVPHEGKEYPLLDLARGALLLYNALQEEH